MAGNSRPSFLKRQKEQKRLERANAKRADRQARREARGERGGEGAPIEALDPADLGPPAEADDVPAEDER